MRRRFSILILICESSALIAALCTQLKARVIFLARGVRSWMPALRVDFNLDRKSKHEECVSFCIIHTRVWNGLQNERINFFSAWICIYSPPWWGDFLPELLVFITADDSFNVSAIYLCCPLAYFSFGAICSMICIFIPIKCIILFCSAKGNL